MADQNRRLETDVTQVGENQAEGKERVKETQDRALAVPFAKFSKPDKPRRLELTSITSLAELGRSSRQ